MTDLPAELRKNPPLGPGAVFFGLGAGFYRPNLAELTHLSCTNTYYTSFPRRELLTIGRYVPVGVLAISNSTSTI